MFTKSIGFTKTGLLSKRLRESKGFIPFGEHYLLFFFAGVYLRGSVTMLGNMDISIKDQFI